MVFIDQDKCIGCGACAADRAGSRIELIDGTAHVKGPCNYANTVLQSVRFLLSVFRNTTWKM